MSPGSAIDRGGGGVRTTAGVAMGVREGCGDAEADDGGGRGEGGGGGGVRGTGSAADAAKETGDDSRGSPGGGGGVTQARPRSASEGGGVGVDSERGSAGGGGGVVKGAREVEGGGGVLSGVREVEGGGGGGGGVDSVLRGVAGFGVGGTVLRVTERGVIERGGWPEGGSSENVRRDEPRPGAGGLGPPGGGALGLVTSRPYPKMKRATTTRMASAFQPCNPVPMNPHSRNGARR
ncbi:hypothetical protein [Polyangium aurulentum]|uniref:hypothetical protein n=1 Tax=Polyangium aurulentum TaxID=2567896 RepID=UPI0010AE35FF|nr:hypothetical protein [Polyangium aurulentum]UQA54857.1 hypothetical protein E8A73_026200 [Polyangium aurulentum]